MQFFIVISVLVVHKIQLQLCLMYNTGIAVFCFFVDHIQHLTVQAAGIGNNLNQIARYFHSGGLASRGMLEELKRCIAEIRELRQEIVQLGGVYRGNSKTHRK